MKRVFFALVSCLALAGIGRAQPTFLFEPQALSASPGAIAIFNSLAIGAGPITYQWYKGDQALEGQTDSFLALLGLTTSDAGEYRVVASMFSGSITSAVAELQIESSFIRLSFSALVRSPGSTGPASWGDYDNDGYPDVFLAKVGTDLNFLFHNDGDGNFTRVTNGSFAAEYQNTSAGAWGDYDNDGWLDLALANNGTNQLFHNSGDGTFTRVQNSGLAGQANSGSAAWGDYDGDGLLDLFFATRNLGFGGGGVNLLYHNNGNGTFTGVNAGPVGTDGLKISASGAWGDANGDGQLDLIVANATAGGFFTLPGDEFLYVNNGNGTFTRNTNGPAGGNSGGVMWVDVDNDLDLDIFIVNLGGEDAGLFLNDGQGAFTRVTAGELVSLGTEGLLNTSAAWSDFDNDGWVDVFLTGDTGHNNVLLRNSGNGTFTKVAVGSPVNDGGNSFASSWVDYDHDGFMDLWVSNISGENFFYRNSGNSNAWLNIRLRGDSANYFGVGAKVKVRTSINGTEHWQLREIAARDGVGSPNTLDANFGLGTASQADLVRVEWPTGVIQDIENVEAGQFLVIAEPTSVFATDGSAREGDEGTRSLSFVVQLTHPTNVPVSVEYVLTDGTAIGGVDFIAATGSVTIAAGEISTNILVDILGDLEDESNEEFTVTLTESTVVPLSRRVARGQILDDDPLQASINDPSVNEGDTGTTSIVFTVSLNKPVDFSVSIQFNTTNGTAVLDLDYLATNGIVTFPPGEIEKEIAVTVLSDLLDENNEIVFVNLVTNELNVFVPDRQGAGTIIDDDPTPTLFLSDGAVVEGNSGTNHAIFTLTLSAPSSRLVSLSYVTTNETATAGPTDDYVSKSGSVAFAPGATVRTLFVVVNGDGVFESNETFRVVATSVTGAILDRPFSVGTIINDEVRIGMATLTEGRVHISFPSDDGKSYRVDWTPQIFPPGVWTPLAGAEMLAGTGETLTVEDPTPPSEPQRFYRIVVLP